MSSAVGTSDRELIWFIDNLAQVHIDGEASRGAYGLVELVGREGDMPPLHVHNADDETFYVLEGRLTLFVGDEVIELEDGQAALAPQGVPHIYRVDSEQARWLALGSPAGFEQFVREAGEPAQASELPPTGRTLDPEALASTAARYGIEILGPPGTLPSA